LNTSCQAIVFGNNERVEEPARDLWLRANRAWIHKGDL
jgi:hypothetical protein